MQFNFGKNWQEFSKKALSPEKIQHARKDFQSLTAGVEIEGKTFLDIGFGQGLALLIASQMGAKAVGCDINPLSSEVLEFNKKKFPELKECSIPVVIGSVLEPNVINDLKKADCLNGNLYDIVHSWGVLHHTGNMLEAMKISSGMVRPNGYLIISIYNRHWTSKIWLLIKWLYNKSPQLIRKLFVYSFVPVIYIAKFLVTGKNPKKNKRGMDFYYDVIDWVGGYPYEYATQDKVIEYMKSLGLKCLRCIPAGVPTGCNEFVFQKESSAADRLENTEIVSDADDR